MRARFGVRRCEFYGRRERAASLGTAMTAGSSTTWQWKHWGTEAA